MHRTSAASRTVPGPGGLGAWGWKTSAQTGQAIPTVPLTPRQRSPRRQVNVLAHWLLANLLVDHERTRRKAEGGVGGRAGSGGGGSGGSGPKGGVYRTSVSASTRVVVMSSLVQRAGSITWGDWDCERRCETETE
jgi:hypothetical protein